MLRNVPIVIFFRSPLIKSKIKEKHRGHMASQSGTNIWQQQLSLQHHGSSLHPRHYQVAAGLGLHQESALGLSGSGSPCSQSFISLNRESQHSQVSVIVR